MKSCVEKKIAASAAIWQGRKSLLIALYFVLHR